MRELCFEEIAMSTGVVFRMPQFLTCRRMSEIRHLTSPTGQDRSSSPSSVGAPRSPQPSQVCRNLFGPVDHDENLKMVKSELSKISQADMRKWNFDFVNEKPLDGGRFDWERVKEGVPQAYEMPMLNCLSNRGTVSTTATMASSSLSTPPTLPKENPHRQTTVINTNTSSTTSLNSSVPENNISTTTASTTVATLNRGSSIQPPPTKNPNQPSSSSNNTTDNKVTSKSQSVINRPRPSTDLKIINAYSKINSDSSSIDTNKSRTQPVTSLKTTRTRSTQSTLTDYMKIRKPTKRPSTSKLEEDQPPALVKRTKTTTS